MRILKLIIICQIWINSVHAITKSSCLINVNKGRHITLTSHKRRLSPPNVWGFLVRGGADSDNDAKGVIGGILGDDDDGEEVEVDGSLFDDDDESGEGEDGSDHGDGEDEDEVEGGGDVQGGDGVLSVDGEGEGKEEEEEEETDNESDGSVSTASSKKGALAKAVTKKARKKRRRTKKSSAESSFDSDASAVATPIDGPSPSSGGIMQQMMVTLGTMAVIKQMDLASPTVIKNARLAFVCYHVVIQLLVLFVEFKCKAAIKNER